MEKPISPVLASNQQYAETPTDDRDRTKRLLESFLSEASSYKAQFGYPSEKDKWLGKYRGGSNLYENKNKLPHQFRSNDFKSQVDKNATLLTSIEPSYDILKKDMEEGGIEAEMMERIVKDVLKKNDSDEMEWNVLLWSGVKGTGIERWEWNPQGECGGFPAGESIDPGQCYINPGALSISKCKYFIYKRPVPTDELKQMFPEFSETIKPDPEISYKTGTGTGGSGYEWYSGADNAKITFDSNSNTNLGKVNQTMLAEVYFMDPIEIELKSVEELGDWVRTNPGFYGRSEDLKAKAFNELNDGIFPKKVKQFPFGRKLYYACGVVLEDYPNPYCRVPFFEYHESPDACSFWGPGIIEKIWEVTSAKHITTVDMVRNARFRANPPYWSYGFDLQDGKVMKLKGGQHVKAKFPNSSISPFPIPDIAPNDLLSAVGYLDQAVTTITGIHPILFGQRESGVYSGTFADKLQDAAMLGMKPKFVRLNKMRTERAKFIIWLIQAYMTNQRKFYYLNEAEEMELMELNQQQATPNGIGYQTVPTSNLSLGYFDPVVEIGIDRPLSKAEQSREALEVAQLIQPFDPLGAAIMAVEAHRLPGKRRIIRDMKKNYAAMQKAQAEQMQKQEQMQMAVTAKQVELEERKVVAEEGRTQAQQVKTGISAQKEAANVDKIKAETINTQMEALSKLNEIKGPAAVNAMLDEMVAELARERING